jgi:hypothetical protein
MGRREPIEYRTLALNTLFDRGVLRRERKKEEEEIVTFKGQAGPFGDQQTSKKRKKKLPYRTG